MGTSFYGIWLSIIGLMLYQDVLSISAPLLLLEVCGAIISNLVFYTLLRSGMNLQLADPSMTFAQLTVGIGWAMVLLISAYEVRDLMLIAYISPVLFGMFKLDQKGFTRLAIVAMTGFLLVTCLDFLLRPESFDPTLSLLRVVVVTLMVGWSSYFGLHVSRLKGLLRKQSRDLKKMVAEVTVLAERDDLTKAYNRRFIMDSLASEKSRSDRTGVPFSVCILDLDHFKLINDRFGHLAGDRVLTAFAERARSEIRNLDLMGRKDSGTWFGRYGGEEFIVLLPNTFAPGCPQLRRAHPSRHRKHGFRGRITRDRLRGRNPVPDRRGRGGHPAAG